MRAKIAGMARAWRVGGAALLVLAIGPGVARAQAWLPSKGSAGFAFDYSDVLNKKHYTSIGDEVDVGHTDVQIFNLSASYSPTDRIALSASLPFVRTRHRGPNGGGHDTEIDEGSWHDTVTDLQLMATLQGDRRPRRPRAVYRSPHPHPRLHDLRPCGARARAGGTLARLLRGREPAPVGAAYLRAAAR